MARYLTPLKAEAKQLVGNLNKAADRCDADEARRLRGRLKRLGLPWSRVEPHLQENAKEILGLNSPTA